MIQAAEFHTLKITRKTPNGFILTNDEGDEAILPTRELTDELQHGQDIRVFIYIDRDQNIVATRKKPTLLLGRFGLLEAVSVINAGAFFNWGIDKDLFVPNTEQAFPIQPGQIYLVHLAMDERTGRPYGTTRIDRYLDNSQLTVDNGQKVELVVYKETDLGFAVVVNRKHRGLIYESDVFQDLNIGDRLPGWVKKIREENKLDISLQPIGYFNANTVHSQKVLEDLVASGGFIPLHDKSAPDDIYARFSISKKAFKRAIGDLYKQQKITIESNGIKLLEVNGN